MDSESDLSIITTINMTTYYNKTDGLSPITRKTTGHNSRKTQSPLSLQPPYPPTYMLLFAFRDLWKEWGDSNFHIFSQSCQFHHRRLQLLEHFKCTFYIILSTTVSFFGPLRCHIIFTRYPFLCVHFHDFCKYTLHVCYVFNVI